MIQIFRRTALMNLLILLFSFITFTLASDIACNADSHCPLDQPCCSQYGVCGNGAYCLGGCDVRFSYNLTACLPQPVMNSFLTTFDDVSTVEFMNDYLGNATDHKWVYSGNVAEHQGDLLLQMPANSVGTVISSTEYLYYGRVGVTMKSSHDTGVISAFIIFSDVQDEVDFEFVGYNLTNPQTNYYYQGQLDYTNSINYTVSNTYENFHYYEIDWHEDRIDWYIDGEKKRTLTKAETLNETTGIYHYPQTPARVQISIWPGGAESNGLGTIEWAGGVVDWNSQDIQQYGYYYATLKSIEVESYGIPDSVHNAGEREKNKNLNAYVYTNAAGHPEDIELTDRLSTIGSLADNGITPNNEPEEEEDDSSSSSKSDSSTSTAAVDVPVGIGNGVNNNQPATASVERNTAAPARTTAINNTGLGGFMQDSSPDSISEGSASSVKGIGAALVALAIGIVSLGF